MAGYVVAQTAPLRLRFFPKCASTKLTRSTAVTINTTFRISSPLDKFDLHTLANRVLDSIKGTARSVIKYSNYTRGMVDHPLIPYLETGLAVPRANEPNEVGGCHNFTILLLPLSVPAVFKALERAGADKFDRLTLISEFKNNLRGPYVHFM